LKCVKITEEEYVDKPVSDGLSTFFFIVPGTEKYGRDDSLGLEDDLS